MQAVNGSRLSDCRVVHTSPWRLKSQSRPHVCLPAATGQAVRPGDSFSRAASAGTGALQASSVHRFSQAAQPAKLLPAALAPYPSHCQPTVASLPAVNITLRISLARRGLMSPHMHYLCARNNAAAVLDSYVLYLLGQQALCMAGIAQPMAQRRAQHSRVLLC